MSYKIHLDIAEDSERGRLIASLAADRHLSPSQAVETILDLVAQKHVLEAKTGKVKIPGLPSEPLSAEDTTIVDEAMSIVMEARRNRSERLFGS